MSGGGVTEISSMVSHGFHPPGASGRTPSASACCRTRQIERWCLWVQGRILLDVARMFSHNLCDIRDAPPSKATAGRQDPGPARGRGLASASRGRPRRRLCEPSVLRPARPRAGQVRDGAPAPGRWTAGDRDRRALRGQPPDVLPDRGRVRGARDPGLVPLRPGPKGAHKCTEAVVDYVERWRAGEDVRPDEPLTAAVARRFGISVHARSLDRAVARRKKKPRP